MNVNFDERLAHVKVDKAKFDQKEALKQLASAGYTKASVKN